MRRRECWDVLHSRHGDYYYYDCYFYWEPLLLIFATIASVKGFVREAVKMLESWIGSIRS
jgi:hypothetical protein